MKERGFSEEWARRPVVDMELTEETETLCIEEEVWLGFEPGVEVAEVVVPEQYPEKLASF